MRPGTHTVTHHGQGRPPASPLPPHAHTVRAGTPMPPRLAPVPVMRPGAPVVIAATHVPVRPIQVVRPAVVVSPNPVATLAGAAAGIAAGAAAAAAGANRQTATAIGAAVGITTAATTPARVIHTGPTVVVTPPPAHHGRTTIVQHHPRRARVGFSFGFPTTVYNTVFVAEAKQKFEIKDIVNLLLDRDLQNGKDYFFRNKILAQNDTKTELAGILTTKLTEIMNGNDQSHTALRSKLQELTHKDGVTLSEVKRFTNHVVKAFAISNFAGNVEVKYARERFLTSVAEFFSALLSLVCLDFEPMKKFRNHNAQLKVLEPQKMLEKLKADVTPDADRKPLDNYLLDLNTRIAYQPSFLDGGYLKHAARVNPNVIVMAR